MKKWLLGAMLAPSLGLLSVPAQAHGVWVAPHYGELGVVYGMGYIDDAYEPERLREVSGFDADFKPVKIEVQPRGTHSTVKAPDETAVLTAFFDNGYWEKGTGGKKWQAVDKSAITKPADTSTSLKYNISLLKPYQGKMKPFDMPAQVIPETDPSLLKQGESLTVTVYVAGKPQAGVPVTADYNNEMKKQVKTDDKGQVTLTVRNAGHNVIAALVNHPTPDDAHAHLQRNVATLSFKAAK
ncbi:MAG: DUF4198 domain-containing protein [Lautropia sp.]|nr:DUF4198 domain-containing protein [Lautropia sp.]